MFQEIDEYISNKDNKFLENSDLVIGWNKKGDIKFNEEDEDLVLLLARLAYVFELVDEEIQSHPEYEEFVEILQGIRIKKTLEDKNMTLSQIVEILSKINDAKQVSIVINEDDYDTIRALISLGAIIGFSKVGLFFKELDEEFYEFRFLD